MEASGLHYAYADGTVALDGVSLSVPRGQRVAMMGANGAGKSTFLLHLNGVYRVQRGTLRILGQDTRQAPESWLRSSVGLVFQDPDNQVFAPSVADDVAFGPLNLGLDDTQVQRRVRAALQAVGMEHLARKAPHHLSFGQKKRVAIAGVLAMQPEIIVLDEPMAFLDPQGQQEVLDIMTELHAQGKTIIVATHDVDMACAWADQVLILEQGHLLVSGGPEILTDPELTSQAGLRLPLIAQVFAAVPQLDTVGARPRTVSQAAALLQKIMACQ
ncbi:MAG: ATP-binding cassette domain-containing protein [Clostridia bacterium]|nr:MAG: ATP-binding cassette domain-containing protein [Clostridia bacterium]